MTDLAKLVVKLEAQTADYQKQLDAAKKQLLGFNRDVGETVKGIAVGIGGAVLGAATALAALVKHTIEVGDHLNDLSKQTGVSVEDLSKLSFAAKQSGTDIDSLAGGLGKFNKAISEAGGNAKSDAAIAFTAMGVAIKDANGNLRPTADLLNEVSTKFAGYRDGANKVAIATALFGKSGADLIPLLNEGASGLAEMGRQAQKAGAVMSKETAEAADKFNDKVGQLKLTLIDGLGNQLAAKLLPSLNALGDQWDADKDRVDALNSVVGVLATALKGLVAAGIGVVSTFQQVGRAIYAIYAAQYDLVKLDFKGAWSEIKDGFGDVVGSVGKDIAKINALFNSSVLGPKGSSTIHQGDHHSKSSGVAWVAPDAPSISAMKTANGELEKALAAQKKLRELDENIREQAATFDLGDAAATRYRLTLGSLSDDVATAGKKGLELRSAIIADAEAFEHLKNVKEISEALKEVNAQIEEFKGHSVAAALASFDKSNEELSKKLRQEGDAAGQKQLQTLRALVEAQAQYNKLQVDAESVQSDLSIAEQKIADQRAGGAITSLQADQKTIEARATARDQLQDIYEQQKKIADESGDPRLIEGVKQFGAQIHELAGQVDIFGQRARATLEDSLGTFFEESIKNIHNLGEAFGNLLDDIAGMFVKFASQQLGQKLIGSLFSSDPNSTSGGFLSSLGALFGGGRATGGPVEPGMAYKVNENTPKSEWFVPSQRGSVVPAGNMGGMSVTQNIQVVAQQGGSVSRATLLQTGAAAARGLAQAQRRNG